jgi:hypothetical protein
MIHSVVLLARLGDFVLGVEDADSVVATGRNDRNDVSDGDEGPRAGRKPREREIGDQQIVGAEIIVI